MAIIIELISLAHDPLSLFNGVYLAAYDPDGNNGRGSFEITRDLHEAKQFDNSKEAFLFWRLQSKVRPYRPDGEPNRPLTSYNVEFKAV